MEKTWRWFGKNDKITLAMLREIGVEGIVTALHDVPNGEIWTREKIRDLREYIESYGMRWSVVESLPVSESIKYAGPDRDQLIENYKQSLRNLAAEGIHTICYNFMPVLDWARTDLLHPNPNGTSNLYFSFAQFAYFDIYILKRENAEQDWKAMGEKMDRDIVGEAAALRQRQLPPVELFFGFRIVRGPERVEFFPVPLPPDTQQHLPDVLPGPQADAELDDRAGLGCADSGTIIDLLRIVFRLSSLYHKPSLLAK